jgi:hypothetical protein
MAWEIFEKLKDFLSKDSSLQSSEEANSLEWELQEKLFPMDMSAWVFDEKEGAYVAKKVRYAYEDMDMPFNLRKEIPTILEKFYERRNQLFRPPFFEKLPILRPYLEDPKKPFSKEWLDSILKIRKFLRDKRVRTIFDSLPTIEIDFKHNEVNLHRLFSPDEVKAFFISVLEPYAFSWIRRTEEGSIYTETICSSTGEPLGNTSKPGPKNVSNRAIILLRILFKECFKQKSPRFYRFIADLFNASKMEGRADWKPSQIKMRYERIRKDSSFNEDWWYECYKNELAMCSNSHKMTGLIELVKK